MLADLEAAIIACRRCPRLRAYCSRVAVEKKRMYQADTYWGQPVPGWGDPSARVLLVGLAPAAHGANRTGRMFTGDGSGDFLLPALHRAGFASQPASTRPGDGLELRDLYMTAAAHCAPPGNKPSRQELLNCRPHLAQHLDLLPRVRVFLALGKIGFDAVLATLAERGLALPHPRPAFGHGAHYFIDPYHLIGSYHPSRQNTNTGRLTPTMLDLALAKVREALEFAI
jgi:uracil-DNA glycosylase family 4